MATAKRLMIIGPGRHGKDTAAKYFKYYFNREFQSSSRLAYDEVIWPMLEPLAEYLCTEPFFKEEVYENRANYRELFKELICAYNRDDKSRLGRLLFKSADIYVGCRARDEFTALLRWDSDIVVIWVEAPGRVGGGEETLELEMADADYVINNDMSEQFLARQCLEIGKAIGW